MYFTLKAMLRTLLLPPASFLLMAMVGALWMRRRPRLSLWLVWIALVSLWLLATPIVANSVYRLMERYPALDLSTATHAEVIVVIGGGGSREFAPEYLGPAPDFGLLERLTYAAFVVRKTNLPLLVSGAPMEAVVMRTALERDFGVAPHWVENQSRDTYENARFSARILSAAGIHRIVLVTSSMHVWRAAHEFQDAGLEVIPAPVGNWSPRPFEAMSLVPEAAALMRSSSAVYEMIGEPMRRLQAALGLREHFEQKARLAP